MKTLGKNNGLSAMTRLEFLVVIGVAIIAVYLVVRYQKDGEVFQIGWRKVAGKTNAETSQSSEMRLDNEVGAIDPTTNSSETNTNMPSIEIIRKSTNENLSPKISGMRLDNPKKQTVRVPTNAVWLPAQRKGPGVRIAFP